MALLAPYTNALASTEKLTAPQSIELASAHPERVRGAIQASHEAEALSAGTAFSGYGPDFFFAVKAGSTPSLIIDDAQGPTMHRVEGSDLWYAIAKIPGVGHAHTYHYLIDGKPSGDSLDVPVFGPLSYRQPRVPSGRLSEKMTHTSSLYDGMKSEYWIYVPAQYDPKVPAALMVFQDGKSYLERDGEIPVLNALDNLIAQGRTPVMIGLFINAGDIFSSPGTPTYNAAVAYGERNRFVEHSVAI